MSLKHGNEHFCYFTFYENGKVFSRRIHRIEVQDCLGRSWDVDGAKLPQAFSVHTGESHKAEHLLEVLCNPKEARKARVPGMPLVASAPWPTGRDVVAMVLGYIAFSLLVSIAEAVSQGL